MKVPGAVELSEVVVERLEHELHSITDMGFAAYFLIVRDIVKRSPRTCGRGSGAASLVAYCLRITTVDPIAHLTVLNGPFTDAVAVSLE